MATSDTRSISVELSVDLFERLRAAATRSDRPLEAVLVESLTLLFGAQHPDRAALQEELETLSDAQLWALVYRRIAWPEGARLRELAARGRQMALTGQEQTELVTLIEETDSLMLLRSRALLVLQKRGHDIREQLQLGA